MFQKSYQCLAKGSSNEKVKILLAYPRTGADAVGFSLHTPLSLLYLCTQLKDFSVVLFDQRVDDMELFDQLLEENPICVGISTMTGKQIEYALDLAARVKKRGIPTVLGGVHPTLLPEQTVQDPRVDFVIAGEGDLAFRQLVEFLKDGREPEKIIVGQPINMDELDLMDVYTLVDIERYIYNHMLDGRCLPFQFSRGCPFKCTFCCNTVLSGNKWRRQSLDKAMGILERMVEEFRLDSVWFVDENLTVDKEVIYGLAKQINGRFEWYIQARSNSFINLDVGYLEKMGLRSIGVGLESGSDRILKKIKKQQTTAQYFESNKKLSSTGIRVWYNYMMGYPDETMDDLKNTVDLALQMMDANPNAYNNTFYVLTPYPGTKIAEDCFRDHMPEMFEDWARFGRHNVEAKWHTPEMLKLYSRITFSSKFTGRKMLRMFPGNSRLKKIAAIFTDKWRNFDFFNDIEWEVLEKEGFDVLQELFGENAY